MLRIYSGAVVRERVGYDGLDHHFLHFLRSIRHLCLSLSLSLSESHTNEQSYLHCNKRGWQRAACVYVTSLAILTARGKLAGVTNDKESVLL